MSDHQETDVQALPEHLIQLASPSLHLGNLLGTHGAPDDLLWQVRDSVSDIVDSKLRFVCSFNRNEKLPDVLAANDALLVSSRLREAIEPWLKDYEFLPTDIELSDDPTGEILGGGQIVEGYAWLNSWRRLDIVDWEKWTGGRGIRTEAPPYNASPLRGGQWDKLVLREPIPIDEHFFGLAGVEHERRYVSKELYKHLRKLNLDVQFRARVFDYKVFAEYESFITQKLSNRRE
ncbi:MAG: hypothetical protein IV086_07915 [Hyphomonadaceae bacterium]|nr:hypothetical protein [Hyphomonadaceae bacterium]